LVCAYSAAETPGFPGQNRQGVAFLCAYHALTTTRHCGVRRYHADFDCAERRDSNPRPRHYDACSTQLIYLLKARIVAPHTFKMKCMTSPSMQKPGILSLQHSLPAIARNPASPLPASSPEGMILRGMSHARKSVDDAPSACGGPTPRRAHVRRALPLARVEEGLQYRACGRGRRGSAVSTNRLLRDPARRETRCARPPELAISARASTPAHYGTLPRRALAPSTRARNFGESVLPTFGERTINRFAVSNGSLRRSRRSSSYLSAHAQPVHDRGWHLERSPKQLSAAHGVPCHRSSSP